MDRCICCFAGHGKLFYGDDVKSRVSDKCRELICDFGVDEFWVSNYGNFDAVTASVVRNLKQEYPHIELALIIPYTTKEIDENKELYYHNYDNILIADIPEGTPKRFHVLKCNQYMVDMSSYLIAYVNSFYGGAAKTLAYAQRKNLIIIFNFGELFLSKK